MSKPCPYHDYAGFVASRKCLVTGWWIVLYDARLADLDEDGGRWVTVCETHGTLCNHRTKKLATSFLSGQFAEWCEDCCALAEANGENHETSNPA